MKHPYTLGPLHSRIYLEKKHPPAGGIHSPARGIILGTIKFPSIPQNSTEVQQEAVLQEIRGTLENSGELQTRLVQMNQAFFQRNQDGLRSIRLVQFRQNALGMATHRLFPDEQSRRNFSIGCTRRHQT